MLPCDCLALLLMHCNGFASECDWCREDGLKILGAAVSHWPCGLTHVQEIDANAKGPLCPLCRVGVYEAIFELGATFEFVNTLLGAPRCNLRVCEGPPVHMGILFNASVGHHAAGTDTRCTVRGHFGSSVDAWLSLSARPPWPFFLSAFLGGQRPPPKGMERPTPVTPVGEALGK